MPRLISAVLFVLVAPSAAMNYWIGNETSGVGNYVWAPRFAPLYGVSGDFNLTAPVEYYTGDLALLFLSGGLGLLICTVMPALYMCSTAVLVIVKMNKALKIMSAKQVTGCYHCHQR